MHRLKSDKALPMDSTVYDFGFLGLVALRESDRLVVWRVGFNHHTELASRLVTISKADFPVAVEA